MSRNFDSGGNPSFRVEGDTLSPGVWGAHPLCFSAFRAEAFSRRIHNSQSPAANGQFVLIVVVPAGNHSLLQESVTAQPPTFLTSSFHWYASVAGDL